MHTKHLTTALLALVASAGATPIDNGPPTAEDATQFTFTYGYPLVAYAKFAVNAITEAKGPNRFSHRRELSKPEDVRVVRPNDDTLYSSVAIDLSCQDLVVDIPAIEDRYWGFPFYDIYGNNYANLGSSADSCPGKYMVRYAPAVKKEPGVQLCDKKSEECDGVDGFINAPTIYGLVLPRLGVKDKGPEDLEKINALQDKFGLDIVKRKHHEDAPPLTVDLLNSTLSEDTPTRVMEMAARFAPYSPPRNIKDIHRVNHMLKSAGIKNGIYESRVENLTRVTEKAESAFKASSELPENRVELQNGWGSTAPEVQGDFGENYEMRAFVAFRGFLQLQISEALYPMYTSPDGEGSQLDLGPDEAYTFTFSGKPYVADTGFWSLTAYNAEQFLVDNPLDRYSLGDRDSLAYADGTPVYDKEEEERDDSFQVLVQPADKEPPQNWTSNWLPAPAGGGKVDVTLRFFEPSEEMQDGTYEFPVVQKHEAVTV